MSPAPSQQLHVLGVLTISLCFCGVLSDNADCNGRGTRVAAAEVCSCENDTPTLGQLGYTGANCDIPVFGADANGEDFTQGCKQEHQCDKLKPDEWFCFLVNQSSTDWNHLTVQLARTSEDEDGDPDLYGLFTGGVSRKDKRPANTTYGYDFRETSAASHDTVVRKVSKPDFGKDMDATGAYLCVKGYGRTAFTYSLRAVYSQCPSDFTHGGKQMMCSSVVDAPESEKRYTGCSADGVCECKAPYQKPLPEVYDGLGFAECTARVVSIADDELTVDRAYLKEHEQVQTQGWAYYAFNVTHEDYQVVVNVAEEEDSQCNKDYGSFRLFAKQGQPPGWHYNQYDFRPAYQYYQTADDEQDQEIKFDVESAGFQTGTWYAGVEGSEHSDCTYTVTINKFDCPMNCSSRGTCMHMTNGSRSCDCDQGFFGRECENEARALEYNKPVARQETFFEYDYYSLPQVADSELTVEVKVQASFNSSIPSYWTSRPELLLLKGDKTIEPTTANYTFKHILEVQNSVYEIDLCPSQLKGGLWRVAIYNPMRMYQVGYNLTALKIAHCLNECSGHGQCDHTGTCHCDPNWAGGDCSVNKDGDCQALWHETAQYSCLQECVCPSGGGPCTPSTHGSTTSFACKHGYKRFSDNSARCYPVGCQEGALQDSQQHVSNGRAYAVCSCDGSESETSNKCGFSTEDVTKMAVACDEGYAVKGARKVGSTTVGGTCVRGAGGTSGLGVFIWILCSVLFALAIAGALLWLQQAGYLTWEYIRNKFLRKSSALDEGLYHELSMDTGF
ncbi:hypothetical protein ABBQ32_014088 [Trebouxia sp. C0010 RCD-2024]